MSGHEALNQEDSKAEIPGVLYGRYALDAYGNKDGGNPWVLITAALANLLYQAAEVTKSKALSSQELRTWQHALNDHSFTGSSKDFLAAGDSVLQRLRHHVSEKAGGLKEDRNVKAG